MFWGKNNKNRHTPAYPSFTVGFHGVYITRTCYPGGVRTLKEMKPLTCIKNKSLVKKYHLFVQSSLIDKQSPHFRQAKDFYVNDSG